MEVAKKRKTFVLRAKKRKAFDVVQKKVAEEEAKDRDYDPEPEADGNDDDNNNGGNSLFLVGCCVSNLS